MGESENEWECPTNITRETFSRPANWGNEEDDLLLDHLRLYIDEKVIVKLHCNRELQGKLHAIDKKCNMILENVTEIATSVGIDDETFEEIEKMTRRTFPFLFVKGERGFW